MVLFEIYMRKNLDRPTNWNLSIFFIGTVSFQIYNKGCNPYYCTKDIKNKPKNRVIISLICNFENCSDSPNYGTHSK